MDLFLTRLGFRALRYKYVKMPKTKNIIKLKTKNFLRIELEFKKVDQNFSAIETRYGSGYRWNVN